MLPKIVKECLKEEEYVIILRAVGSYRRYWDLIICRNSPQGSRTLSTVVFDHKYQKPEFLNSEFLDTRLANYISELLSEEKGASLYLSLEELADYSGRFGNRKK